MTAPLGGPHTMTTLLIPLTHAAAHTAAGGNGAALWDPSTPDVPPPDASAHPAPSDVAVHVHRRGHAGHEQPEVGRSALGAWGAAVRGAADPALLLDSAGAVVAVSASAAALLDRRVGELLGRPLGEAVAFVDFHHSPRPVTQQAWPTLVPLSTLRSGSPGRGLLRVRRADGRLQAADAVAAALHDGHGRSAGALVMLSAVRN